MGGLASAGLLGLGIVGVGAAGLGLLGCRTSSKFWQLGLAVGFGFSSILLFSLLWLLVVGRLDWWPLLVLAFSGVAFALAQLLRLRTSAARPRWKDPFLLLVVLAALLVVAGGYVDPFAGYDAKAIYGLKAKALLHDRNLGGALFQDPEVVHLHGDYPLGLSVLMAFSGWVAEGDPEDPRGEQPAASAGEWVERYDTIDPYGPLAASWPIGLLLLVSARVRELARNGAARAGLLVLSLSPMVLFPWVFIGDAALAGADIPLALVLGCCLVAVCAWLRGDGRQWLVVLALFAASALTLKLDAVVGLGTLAIALATQQRRSTLPAIGALAVGSAVGLGLWLGLRLQIVGAPYDEAYLDALFSATPMSVVERLPLVLRATGTMLLERGVGLYWLAVFALGVPLGWARGGASRFLAVWLVLFLFACTFVFLVTPAHAGWQISTSLTRLWCQVAVPAAFLLLSATADLWSEPETGGASAAGPSHRRPTSSRTLMSAPAVDG